MDIGITGFAIYSIIYAFIPRNRLISSDLLRRFDQLALPIFIISALAYLMYSIWMKSENFTVHNSEYAQHFFLQVNLGKYFFYTWFEEIAISVICTLFAFRVIRNAKVFRFFAGVLFLLHPFEFVLRELLPKPEFLALTYTIDGSVWVYILYCLLMFLIFTTCIGIAVFSLNRINAAKT
ncbi:hypothetical protein GYB22_01425 [bacterium]|nr:hypothetical protein [bacterium]